MPSPIAHAAAGYLIYRTCRHHNFQPVDEREARFPRFLVLTIVLSGVPDLDFIPGLLFGDVGRFHNNIAHSLVFGCIVALVVGAVVWLVHQRSGFLPWFLLTLVCYEAHVIMDFFTDGRGVMILWPFSPERYEPAVKVFYGFHRSDGLMSVRHIWTLVNELGFVLLTVVTVHFLFGVPSRWSHSDN